MAEYNYTKEINAPTLTKEIEDSAITPQLIGVTVRGADNVTIEFTNDLDGGEITSLASIVSSHTNTATPVVEGSIGIIQSFGDADGNPIKSKTTILKKVRTLIFLGTDFYGKAPVEATAVVYTKSDTTTGTIRLYDATNDVEIGSATFSGTSSQLITIPCSNWPADKSQIELQMKADEKQEVYMSVLSIIG